MLVKNAIESPKGIHKDIPNNVVRLSAASRISVVEMASSLEASTGTSCQLFLTPSKKVVMLSSCGLYLYL